MPRRASHPGHPRRARVPSSTHARRPRSFFWGGDSHDYQRIVPDFRGDGIAFPSDQGLHIANKSGEQFVPNLISAVGDMRNTMSLSALIAPSTTKPGSRNLVVNIWDW